MTNLEGKVALVTGGASGIGAATVEVLLEAGAKVIAVDIQGDRLKVLAEGLTVHGDNLDTVEGDLSTGDGVQAAVEEAKRKFGPITILANVAGRNDGTAGLLNHTEEGWALTYAINVDAPFRLSRALIPGMLEAGGGSIVIVASALGLVAGGAGTAYTSSKHAAVGLTKELAAEFGPQGIRVNCIAPGLVETPMYDALPAASKEGFAAAAAATAVQRMAKPREIAEAIGFFVSDQASFAYGSIVAIDGGYVLT
jgi:3-oxoacyl-[acyl-carrier protein] reductase